ncbi:hypothetical protein ABDK00_017550 [Niabella insulamsoli]|uniref:hypothetical protein n=1 Tax=Niabella insulamsoli TaxID=3144874 RepID=UPI0031FCACB1
MMVKSILTSLIALIFLTPALEAQTAVDRSAFYQAMASGSTTALSKQLEITKEAKGTDKEALQGALLMRKSKSQKTAGQKLSMFKQGHRLLEGAISKEPANVEYKFLRLMIQEHAPKIVGYYKNIAEDAKILKASYKSLSSAVQKALLAYSNTSNALKGLH